MIFRYYYIDNNSSCHFHKDGRIWLPSVCKTNLSNALLKYYYTIIIIKYSIVSRNKQTNTSILTVISLIPM